MKIIFTTHCDSWLQERFGTHKLVNSFKYYHPDIEMVVYDERETKRLLDENPGFCRVSHMGLIMKDVKDKYQADMVVHLDSDSLVLSRLDEILEGDFDIASVRNDCDHDRDESINRPYPIRNLPNDLYVNCGCIAITNDKVLDDWINLNKEVIKEYGNINVVPLAEQGTFNLIFHSGRYKTRILDPLGGNLFYGATANFDSSNNYIAPSILKEYNGDFYNWSSWYDIEYHNNKFWLNNKICKIIHAAGGGSWANNDKLHWDRFNPKIIPKLQEITKCQT